MARSDSTPPPHHHHYVLSLRRSRLLGNGHAPLLTRAGLGTSRSLLTTFVEIKSDTFKLLFLYKRPVPRCVLSGLNFTEPIVCELLSAS